LEIGYQDLVDPRVEGAATAAATAAIVTSEAATAAAVGAALDELAVIGEPVNRVLDVDLDGDEVTLTLYDLPPAGS
jgi:hypothetical protein